MSSPCANSGVPQATSSSELEVKGAAAQLEAGVQRRRTLTRRRASADRESDRRPPHPRVTTTPTRPLALLACLLLMALGMCAVPAAAAAAPDESTSFQVMPATPASRPAGRSSARRCRSAGRARSAARRRSRSWPVAGCSSSPTTTVAYPFSQDGILYALDAADRRDALDARGRSRERHRVRRWAGLRRRWRRATCGHWPPTAARCCGRATSRSRSTRIRPSPSTGSCISRRSGRWATCGRCRARTARRCGARGRSTPACRPSTAATCTRRRTRGRLLAGRWPAGVEHGQRVLHGLGPDGGRRRASPRALQRRMRDEGRRRDRPRPERRAAQRRSRDRRRCRRRPRRHRAARPHVGSATTLWELPRPATHSRRHR